MFWEEADHCHVRASTSKYGGCLLFKDFGILVDSNTIDITGRISVDVHSLGQETESEAPFHCVIAPEVSKRFSHGRGISAASTPTSVSWNAANQALVSPGLKIGFADNS